MKICQVVYGIAGGGAPNVALSLLKSLSENGHEIHLVRLNVPYNNEKEKSELEKLHSQGIKTFILNRRPGQFTITSLIELRKIIRNEKYDVIHSHLLLPDIYSAIAYLTSRNKATHFITVHNTLSYHKKIFLSTVFYKSVFVRCSHAIRMINSKISDYVIPNGIDIEKFRPDNPQNKDIRNELGISEDCVLIVSVGNLRIQKNQIAGIEMMNALVNNDKLNNIHYLICGEGSESKKLAQLVLNYNVSNNIHFLGLRNDIPSILKSSDFFVNFSKWEGLPLAVIEAFASGISVILSPITEHLTIGKNVNRCFIAQNFKGDSFAKIIKENLAYLDDSSNLETFSSREKILESYSMKSFSEAYENLYLEYTRNKVLNEDQKLY